MDVGLCDKMAKVRRYKARFERGFRTRWSDFRRRRIGFGFRIIVPLFENRAQMGLTAEELDSLAAITHAWL